MTYPISQGRALNVAAVIHAPEQEGSIYRGPWTSSVDREELVKEFVGWDANVQEIMKVGEDGPTRGHNALAVLTLLSSSTSAAH